MVCTTQDSDIVAEMQFEHIHLFVSALQKEVSANLAALNLR
jgi:hypothetical protein